LFLFVRSIFPENEWEEKHVIGPAGAASAAMRPKSTRATISLQRHAAIADLMPVALLVSLAIFRIAESAVSG
jgi:hypothetical protein